MTERMNPMLYVTNFNYFQLWLGTGKENAKKKLDLYETFKGYMEDDHQKPLTYPSFGRLTRKICESARKNGIMVIDCADGVFIAKDHKEYSEYKRIKIKGILNELQQLAAIENISINRLMSKELYPPRQKENNNNQLNFLEAI